MEAEIAEAGGADSLLRRMFSFRTPGPLFLPKGQWYKDLPPYPSWLPEEEAAYYRDTFNKTGFTGGLNYYRAFNLYVLDNSFSIGCPCTFFMILFCIDSLEDIKSLKLRWQWCRNWEITAPWTGAQVKVPVKFIVGDLDLTYHMPGVKDYVDKGGMKKDVPLLQDVVILEGVGHFLQEEQPEVINKHIHDFLQKF